MIIPRVLMIARGIYPVAVGGVEIHIDSIAKILCKQLPLTILAEGETDHHFNYDVIFSTKKLRHTGLLNLAKAVVFGVIKTLKLKKKYNLIHAQTASIPLLTGFIVSLVSNTPLIVSCHASEIRTRGMNSSLKYLQKIFLCRARAVLATTNEIARILREAYGLTKKPIIIIPNGFDEELLSVQNSYESCNKITCVGSLRFEKDPFNMAGALSLVKKSRDGIVVEWIGNGPLRVHLEKYLISHELQSDFILLGQLCHEDALMHIQNSDLFVIPSQQEGLPTVLLESMALARPIISTNVGGIPEIIQNRINGILVDSGNSVELANAILELTESRELREFLGTNARKRIEAFSWNRIASKYLSIYYDIINQGRVRRRANRILM